MHNTLGAVKPGLRGLGCGAFGSIIGAVEWVPAAPGQSRSFLGAFIAVDQHAFGRGCGVESK